MFLSVKSCKKEDLAYVAIEIGEVVPETARISDLKSIILNSHEYKTDPEFVKGLLEDSVTERKIKEEKEQDMEKFKLKQQQEIELEKLKLELELAKFKAQDQNQGVISQEIPEASNAKKKFSLPKLQFRQFGDDLKEWLPFWSQFEHIDKDPDIAPENKFQYLVQATVVGSRAREVIESFPPTGENYAKAVDSLKARFGREDILVEVYVRELLKLIISVQSNQKLSPTFLYDKIETYLRALETLGVTTDKCASILYPMVESCFDEEFLKAWNRSPASSSAKDAKERLENLMLFLKGEVEGQERISLAMAGFGVSKREVKMPSKEKNIQKFQRGKIPTASMLLASSKEPEIKKPKCIFCSGKHASSDCFNARKLTLEEKLKIVRDKNCCFACLLPGHSVRKCQKFLKCPVCSKKHVILMCDQFESLKNTNQKKEEEEKSADSEVNLSNFNYNPKVFLQTLRAKLISDNKEKNVRILLDTGSQKSYVLKTVAEEMEYKPLRQESTIHALFGGVTTKEQKHNCYKIRLKSLNDRFKCNFEVLDQAVICDNIRPVGKGSWCKELRNLGIKLTDVDDTEEPIHILVGADIAGKLFTGRREMLSSGLVAMETQLGWCLMGKLPIENEEPKSLAMITTSLFIKEADISDLWKLDLVGIVDPVEKTKSKAMYSYAIKQFNETVTVLPSGRYEVTLPFKDNIDNLPSNEALTLRRHEIMCKRAATSNYLKDYKDVFNEWERLKIIERVPDEEAEEKGHYLPHRPVIKEVISENIQSMKIRPVFDASARDGHGPSLNDCLIKGPNLIELIPDVLDRFRIHPIGVSADIEKAFLQLSIIPEHRDYLRFFFPCENEKIKYRHCRVVFGVSSSPFLLAASLNHLLDNVPDNFKEIGQKLKHSFYVDNCVTGVSTVKELEAFIEDAVKIMSSRCFNLRGWESNVPSKYTTKSSGITSLLGLMWNLDQDTLSCSFKMPVEKKSSKRSVLATVQQIFDPIGVLCPATLVPKLILQDMWKIKLSWDAVLPEEFQKRIDKWLKDVSYLSEIQVPRFIEMNDSTEFHVFVDACKTAYAACIFARSETANGVKIHLLRAKSRVAPIKEITIPRLELIACSIGSRLAHSVQIALDIPAEKFIFWSDSMSALWWIKQKGEWSIFVGNRVKEINQLFPSGNWRHVPGAMNIADLPSRGCNPRQLYESGWWKGPEWLRKNREDWPADKLDYQSADVDLERRKVRLSNVVLQEEITPWYAVRFSNFRSIVRLVAWVLRFANNCRRKIEDRDVGELSNVEYEKAERTLIRCVQSKHLESKNLNSLIHTYIDNEGIIRIKTRITERSDYQEFLSPIVLPDKCIFTRRLIEHFHKINCHAGTQILLSMLREKYWIIRGRKTVREVVKSCVKCRRYTAKSFESAPVSLPADRVNDSAVFEIIGVDLAGPLFVKGGEKAWIVLFTCAVYRAIHLELISSLSTDAFVLCLRRFIARRGRPRIIFCDNGSNFRGTFGELSAIDWNKVVNRDEISPIIWKFNPPSAAWWGGFWERLVRCVKELLRRSLGKAVLNFEELQTILCDCEAVINSRPLTYLSEDSDDLVPITPSMFLRENHSSLASDIDLIDSNCLRKRIKYRLKLITDLRKRFRKEYLGLLIQRAQQKESSRMLKVNEIVLIGDDVKKRINWPLGRITELIPGKDGKIRTVRVKTRSGTLIRPVQRVFSLEADTTDFPLSKSSEAVESVSEKTSDTKNSPDQLCTTKTRYGRIVKKPNYLDLFNQELMVFESSPKN